MTEPVEDEGLLARKLKRMVAALVIAGALVQILLSAYYLGVAHSPGPRHLPVGYSAQASSQPAIKKLIETGGAFRPGCIPTLPR